MQLVHSECYADQSSVHYLCTPQKGRLVIPVTDQAKAMLWNHPGPLLTLKYHHGTHTSPESSPKGNESGFGHVAFQVDNVSKAVDKARAEQVHILEEAAEGPSTNCAFIRDPDGHAVQLSQRYKQPIYRGPGKVVFDGEWSDPPVPKIRGLINGMANMYRTLH
eukprot:TRINITY_DN2200_c0_g1_i1.p1 TRINITY_DN2200_c0_g1~~TRINITY_DN2200_c0_g1_i1.p1  ORF type:complete len:163 (-),score=30.55 TRINITY_DN2200_c0_g1_i1:79-567(-)